MKRAKYKAATDFFLLKEKKPKYDWPSYHCFKRVIFKPSLLFALNMEIDNLINENVSISDQAHISHAFTLLDNATH